MFFWAVKGGVGKTTIAYAAAKALGSKGCTVGMLDLDVTSPKLPVEAKFGRPQKPLLDGGAFHPWKHGDFYIFSAGCFVPKDWAMMWSGHTKADVISQMFRLVRWPPEVDVVIVDMPPQSDDVATTTLELVMNKAPFTGGDGKRGRDGVVLVTLPREMDLVDLQRAKATMDTYKIEPLGVVLNQTHIMCPKCFTRHSLALDDPNALLDRMGLKVLADVPLIIDGGEVVVSVDEIMRALEKSRFKLFR